MLLIQFSKYHFIISVIQKRKVNSPLPSPPKPSIQTHP